MSTTITSPYYIPRYTMVPKRDMMGRIIEGKFRMFWGGRKPSRYAPHVGKKQQAKIAARAA